MRKFYVVMRKGQEVPARRRKWFKHYMTVKAACKEARRLSCKYPEDSFRIFAVIGQYKNGVMTLAEWPNLPDDTATLYKNVRVGIDA